MKLALEEKLLEQKLRFYLMINGMLATGFFVTIAYVAYIVLSRIFE
jgi:hypothetical protein